MRSIASLVTVVALSLSSIAAVGCATSDDGDFGSESDEAATAGKFNLWQSVDGQFHFNLTAGNGQILLASEAYSTRTGAINGILSVQENGVDKARYAVAPAANGFVVQLLAANRQIIGVSEVYSTKSNATRAITSSVNAVLSYLDRREASSTGARVDVLAGETGKFRFNVVAKNGEVVLSSEAYTTEAAAYNGALAVQESGRARTAYTVKQNVAGGFYFTLSARNGAIIGTSEQYTTRQSAEAAIESLIALLPAIAVL